MKTILVATDGSEAAEDALEVAIELARGGGCQARSTFGAGAPSSRTSGLRPADARGRATTRRRAHRGGGSSEGARCRRGGHAPRSARRSRRRARRRRDQVGSRPDGRRISRTWPTRGSRAGERLACAREPLSRAAHDRPPRRRRVVSSSHHLAPSRLRKSRTRFPMSSPMAPKRARGMLAAPALNAGHREEDVVKNIMVATDGSESAAEAVDAAIELARQMGAKLQVLAVRPPRVHGRAGSGPADDRDRGDRTAPSTSPTPPFNAPAQPAWRHTPPRQPRPGGRAASSRSRPSSTSICSWWDRAGWAPSTALSSAACRTPS